VVAFDDATDDIKLFFGAVEQRLGARELGSGNGSDEADAHVESAHHLFLRDLAEVTKVVEDGQHRPGAELDLCGGALGQNAGQVLGDASTGDVGHAGGHAGGDQLLNHVQVAAVGLHQRRACFFLDGGDVLRGFVSGDFEQQFAS